MLLKIKFITHESSYWGVYYLNKQIDNIGKIQIKNNFFDNDWQFIDDKDCPIIIYLDDVRNGEQTLDIIINKLNNSIKKVLISEIQCNHCNNYLYINGKKVLLNKNLT